MKLGLEVPLELSNWVYLVTGIGHSHFGQRLADKQKTSALKINGNFYSIQRFLAKRHFGQQATGHPQRGEKMGRFYLILSAMDS
jgi:hypothetical protein